MYFLCSSSSRWGLLTPCKTDPTPGNPSYFELSPFSDSAAFIISGTKPGLSAPTQVVYDRKEAVRDCLVRATSLELSCCSLS